MSTAKITNAMSVDVEDYFQVSAFESTIKRSDWDSLECRVEANTNRILEMFARHDVKATFFVLGWVAEKFPSLVKTIVADGHELASHGFSHKRVTQLSPEEFREEVVTTKKLLEDLGGVQVNGYRAPSYSIGADNLWALDELNNAGYRYSSSIYPINHDLYGMPEASRFPFYPRGEESILEIPITTFRLKNKNFPCGGGGFFRLYPYLVTRWAIAHVNKKDNKPGIFYFHPWEIDPEQPRQQGISLKTRFRHYLNLERTTQRLERLMQDFNWNRMDEVFEVTN